MKISSNAARPMKPISARKRKQSISEDDFALKDPIMLAIENDINSRRNIMAGWEDLTETGIQLPAHPADIFFSRLEGHGYDFNTNASRIRKRIGRGGRVLIDREIDRTNLVKEEAPEDEHFFHQMFYLRLKQSENLDLERLKIKHQTSEQLFRDPKKLLYRDD